MMSRRWLVSLASLTLIGAWTWTPAAAQSPSVLYTWDHSIGRSVGPNVEGWNPAGTNVPALSNATDGILTISESTAGGNWSVSENYNYIKESAANTAGGVNYDFGGVDVLGLDFIEFDVTNDATQDISGQVYFQPDGGGGCCGFYNTQFTLAPGGGTIKADLNAMGLSAAEMKYIRSFTFEVYSNSEPSPVTWGISEIRATGTPLTERVIADYSSGGLEHTSIDYDGLAILNGANGTQNGLSNSAGSLRWVDRGGTGDPGSESGGTVAWGNNNANRGDFGAKPLDISNYYAAEITMRIQPGTGADATLGMQLYSLHVDRASANQFDYDSVAFNALVDNMVHTYTVPLAGLGADQDLVQWLGLDLFPHNGQMQVFVSKVVLTMVPEPTSLMLLGISLVGLACHRARRH